MVSWKAKPEKKYPSGVAIGLRHKVAEIFFGAQKAHQKMTIRDKENNKAMLRISVSRHFFCKCHAKKPPSHSDRKLRC